MTEKKTYCMPCCQALGSSAHKLESSFLLLKDRGSLFKPTESVITVCEETEKCFQRMTVTDGKLRHCKGIVDGIAVYCVAKCYVFSVLV
jgi:CRISPR/Cas system-associated protein endoribonuclease Cas2